KAFGPSVRLEAPRPRKLPGLRQYDSRTTLTAEPVRTPEDALRLWAAGAVRALLPDGSHVPSGTHGSNRTLEWGLAQLREHRAQLLLGDARRIRPREHDLLDVDDGGRGAYDGRL